MKIRLYDRDLIGEVTGGTAGQDFFTVLFTELERAGDEAAQEGTDRGLGSFVLRSDWIVKVRFGFGGCSVEFNP